MAGPHIAALYRYPVKGLTPHRLEEVDVEDGGTFPFDRAYAIENGASGFDPEAPKHFPKINFLMLARNERLAALDCRFDQETHTLTIYRHGKQVSKGALNTGIGRNLIEQFFAAYSRDELRGAPRILCAEGHSFSDKAQKCVHIVNLATVRDLGRSLGVELDPLRFRANIYIDGVEPWREREWVDCELGIGAASVQIFDRTKRCDATNVDPSTGVRNLAIPASLVRDRGHLDLGIYGTVTQGGRLVPGDEVRPPEADSIRAS